MWQQLIWKQWKEQSWRIAFATVILTAFTAIGLRARVVSDDLLLAMTILFGGLIVPVFLAMGLVAPLRAERSFDNLLALPVKPVKLFLVIALTGVVGCLLPAVASAVAALCIAGEREMSILRIVGVYGMFVALAMFVMFWTLCLSIRQRHESGVALVGIAFIVAHAAILFAYAAFGGNLQPGDNSLFWTLHPLGLFRWVDWPDMNKRVVVIEMSKTLVAQVVIFYALGWWATRRMVYSKQSKL